MTNTRQRRSCWVEGAKHGLSGGNFASTPYPVNLKDKTGAPLSKAQPWARGYLVGAKVFTRKNKEGIIKEFRTAFNIAVESASTYRNRFTRAEGWFG